MTDIKGTLKNELGVQAGRQEPVGGKGVGMDDLISGINNKLSSNESELKEKWSEKYKKSIDCKNPKGFSQRAHCQGKKKKAENKEATGAASAGGYEGSLFSTTKRKIKEELLKGGFADGKTLRDIAKKHHGNIDLNKFLNFLKTEFNKGIKIEKEHTKKEEQAKEITLDHLWEDPKYYSKLKKMETKEATSSSSSGSYVTPAAWAKSTKKKDWRGRSKTQIPGGKFVTVKNKCKTFPYCNQGDIKALKLYENEIIKKVITKISKEQNISENVIKSIIQYQIEKYKNNSIK